MRALILAAGEGSRLRPLTEHVPKPMLEIAGRPILEHNVRLLARYGIRDIVINLHHHPEAVIDHFRDGAQFGVAISYSYEPELLGTAGALNPIRSSLTKTFLVLYGDNLSTCDLGKLLEVHDRSEAVATIALFEREDVTASGIVGIDDDDRITRFLEKPRAEEVFSHWVNAGILALEPDALDAIPRDGFSDFGRDVLPDLLASHRKVGGYRMTEELWWIDSLPDYERTRSSVDASVLERTW